MIYWHLDVQAALMDLLYWFLIACFGIGAAALLLDVFLPRDRDE